MKTKTRMTVTQNRTIIGIFWGIITAVAISLTLLAVTAGLITGNKLNEESSHWVVFFIRAAAVLTGVLVGTGITGEKCFITTGIIVAGYLVILLGLGVVLYDEGFRNFWNGLLSTMIGGIVGGLIRLKLQNKPRRSKKIKV